MSNPGDLRRAASMRQGLVNARELRVFDTFVPRGPGELVDWLDALPEEQGTSRPCSLD